VTIKGFEKAVFSFCVGSTLMKHYVAVKTSKKRRKLLGIIEEKPLNFGDWIKQFVPIVQKRYAELRATAKSNEKSISSNHFTFFYEAQTRYWRKT